MTKRILVAYATKSGSTREVAEAVAATLGADGADVDCIPARAVETVDPYDSVVLGGGLYTGRLHKEAQRFLHDHRAELARLPFAVFAMGPDELTEEKVAQSRRQLDHALAKVPEVRPVAITIFGGVVNPEKLRFPFNRMPACDARDWHAIDAWAEEVAGAFAGTPTAARG